MAPAKDVVPPTSLKSRVMPLSRSGWRLRSGGASSTVWQLRLDPQVWIVRGRLHWAHNRLKSDIAPCPRRANNDFSTAPTSDFQSSPNNGHCQTRTGPLRASRAHKASAWQTDVRLSLTLMYDPRLFIKPLHSFGARHGNRC